MDKVVKSVLISDLILLIGYLFSRRYFDFSSLIDSIFLSFIIFLGFFVIFVLFALLIKKILARKDKKKKVKSSFLIYIFSIVLSLILAFVFFNSSLYIQALLGNDLYLSLDLDKDIFSVQNGNSFSIDSNFKVITNPFCSSSCSIVLTDLSTNKIISREELNFSISTIISRSYEIFVDEEHSGQKVYRIDFSCTTKEATFCYVPTNKTKYTSNLVVLEHFLSEKQSFIVEDFKSRIIRLEYENTRLSKNLNDLENFINNSSTLDLSLYSNEVDDLINNLNKNNMNLSIYYFYNQQFSNLEKELNIRESFINSSKDKFLAINDSIFEDINKYNNLSNNLSKLDLEVSNYLLLNLDNSSIISLSNFIDLYNEVSSSFSNFSTISKKESSFEKIIISKNSLSLVEIEDNSSKLNKELFHFVYSPISFNYSLVNFSFELSNLSSVCCIFGSCSLCLENSSSFNYPVILLHGHSFNERISAFASLDLFNSFQIELEKFGYLNAGSFFYPDYSSDSRGILGKMNYPISIKASYYFDTLSNDEGYSLLETKANNLDTYAIRLKEIVDNVKYITGKDKVVIVAHSMGGLVARRYVQVFGDSSVDKLILVTVPNNGVDGFVVDYCSLFGTEDECTDMNSGSLFLNKLNRGDKPSIPIYNFVGEGCSWENAIGDGIVKNDSAYLSFANNIYLNGTCDGFTYFHNEVLDLEKYPEVFVKIKDILESNETFVKF